ncbi:MAG: hypothetical protein NUV56_02365 [Candidatus Uhrbacteria bacterium]|nr:hypothetical protein [Candidatus Uhrbacteria bacterium]
MIGRENDQPTNEGAEWKAPRANFENINDQRYEAPMQTHHDRVDDEIVDAMERLQDPTEVPLSKDGINHRLDSIMDEMINTGDDTKRHALAVERAALILLSRQGVQEPALRAPRQPKHAEVVKSIVEDASDMPGLSKKLDQKYPLPVKPTPAPRRAKPSAISQFVSPTSSTDGTGIHPVRRAATGNAGETGMAPAPAPENKEEAA